jgi:hypothetical protein
MQALDCAPVRSESVHRTQRERLTPADYSKAGLLQAYDWSVQEREEHDKNMEKYRHYLMKLCSLSHSMAKPNTERDER